ncbi:hypothetical protein [Eubacterium sp.]|uniref:hypothetical protein n=1 Tax=Eubacterium sp. TaxID=142586 RepID=UPI0025DD14F8|nr:hypothetical protein [Eubacterium sp.]MCR5629642.1 hypothetical protein [Eubacterium sp.]
MEKDFYREYLDLSHWYRILVPKTKEAENDLYDNNFFDENNDCIKEEFDYMEFHEDTFCFLESRLFDFINVELDIIINMYEDEIINNDQLSKAYEITKRMILNSDDEKFIKLAEEFQSLIEKAQEYGTVVGLYF